MVTILLSIDPAVKKTSLPLLAVGVTTYTVNMMTDLIFIVHLMKWCLIVKCLNH